MFTWCGPSQQTVAINHWRHRLACRAGRPSVPVVQDCSYTALILKQCSSCSLPMNWVALSQLWCKKTGRSNFCHVNMMRRMFTTCVSIVGRSRCQLAQPCGVSRSVAQLAEHAHSTEDPVAGVLVRWHLHVHDKVGGVTGRRKHALALGSAIHWAQVVVVL
eukprot:114680-Chlamydomonas_euryale.AAC.4